MHRTLSGTIAAMLFIAASLVASTETASAALVISNAATNNVTCTGGVCSPSGPAPVLNAVDLQNMLAAGDTTVAMPLNDIKISAPITWASGSRLTLDAHHSILINKAISVTGAGALTLTVNDGGSGGDYIFGGPAHVTFANLTSSLIINGASYSLINTVAGLASAVAANPHGYYALAQSYDALADGYYPTSPVPGIFSGRFEGLANTISRLRIDVIASGVSANAGLFDTTDGGTLIRDLKATNALVKLTITGHGPNTSGAGVVAGLVFGQIAYVTTSGSVQSHIVYPMATGGLIGYLGSSGLVRDSRSSATVNGLSTTHTAYSGGLIGWSEQSTVLRSAATGAVTSKANVQGTYAAGLIGRTDGVTVSQSWASGATSSTGNIEALAGGLIGYDGGASVTDCYSLGNSVATVSSHNVFTGGLVAESGGPITTSYSTGSATTSGGSIHYAGGFIGEVLGTQTDDYWDMDTSGTSNATGSGSSAGITGLSDAALLAAVPSGFSASVWAQSPTINNGYPYLINNAP